MGYGYDLTGALKSFTFLASAHNAGTERAGAAELPERADADHGNPVGVGRRGRDDGLREHDRQHGPSEPDVELGHGRGQQWNLVSQGIVTSDGVNVTQSYGYDAYNRLNSEQEGTWSQAYKYLEPGNWYISTNSGLVLSPFAPTSASAYNAKNQLVSMNSTTATYDPSGNQYSAGGFGFTVDGEGRLKTSTINGVETDYTYDGLGRRVRKATASAGTNSVYVYDATGQMVAEYSNEPPGAPGTPATEYLAVDHLGSTRLVTDAGGVWMKRYDYLPFGEDLGQGVNNRGSHWGTAPPAVAPTEDAVDVKFTGKERDAETVLDYFGARYLSGAQGRFTSPDPLLNSGRPREPQSWNRCLAKDI